MIYSLVGILIGVIVGLNIEYVIPIEYIKYTAVLIIGMLDALFGAIKAELTKASARHERAAREESGSASSERRELTKEDGYNQTIFITGLIFNTILALIITLLGEKLGLDLYLAVTVVFILRIFSNLGATRREIVNRIIKKKKTFF